MNDQGRSVLVTALKDADWKTVFRTVADWLEAVDDHDDGILLDAADELRERADQ